VGANRRVVAVSRQQAIRWRAPVLTPQRVDLRFRGRGLAAYHARSVYRPLRRRERLAQRVVSGAVALGLGGTVPAPVDGLDELARDLGLSARAMSARRSWAVGRWVVAFAGRRGLTAVAKVGQRDDDSLRNEGIILPVLGQRDLGVDVPRLIFAGEWSDRYVVVTRTLGRPSAPVFDLVAAEGVARHLTSPRDGGDPLVHGDLTPWNLWQVGSRLAVFDFELAAVRCTPLFDLAKFVAWTGAVTGSWPPIRAVELLTHRHEIGVAHLRALGFPSDAARAYVAAFLDDQHGGPTAVRTYLAQMRSLL
jgi:Phosphotransferase enzyme family